MKCADCGISDRDAPLDKVGGKYRCEGCAMAYEDYNQDEDSYRWGIVNEDYNNVDFEGGERAEDDE